MAFAISFTTNLTTIQYDQIWHQLREAKADFPKGRLSHVGWAQEGTMRVVDVWESMDDFEAFGETLMPIIASVGGEATPSINPAHHFQAS
jgi:hypothetical protein